MTLLSPEATGGEIATAGFGFQDAVLLAKIPRFMAEDGFTAIIREAICDFEASFFDPATGVRREGYEAKDYSLTPGKFWEEVDTFARIDATDAAVYGGFTLVTTGLSDKIEPVVNGLRRAREPYPFYPQGSGILTTSYADYEQRIRDQGKSASIAQLLFDKVRIEPRWSTAFDEAFGVFTSALNEFHPWSLDCRGRDIQDCYQKLKALVVSRKNRPIRRAEIEAVFSTALPVSATAATSTRLHTASGSDDSGPLGSLSVNWERFSGNAGRQYPSPSEWESGVIRQLRALRSWVVAENRPRRIRLSGSRRLSTSLAIGWALPAVAGFSIEIEYRGAVWASDSHADEVTPAYTLESRLNPGIGDRLVATVGVLRDVAADVTEYLGDGELAKCPRLDMSGTAPIVSDRQLNLVVRDVKEAISKALVAVGAKSVDLFLAGPAPLALFLGHRLNAIAPIRCYEWVEKGKYSLTCDLPANS